jgi:hypothetical protein
MANSKRKREEAKQRLQQKLLAQKRRRQESTLIDARMVARDIFGEINYIILRAQAEESRIVTFRDLVMFSTQTRDAWLLDPEDDFALCLCRDGEPQPFHIVDAPTTFAIDWQAKFSIEDGAFIVQERSGRVLAIHGYPTAEISEACQR